VPDSADIPAGGYGPVVEFATDKGARQAEEILAAALRSLATHGYAATSLQRIADEAGTHKRMVLYYWGSRERLIEEVVRRVGDRLLDQVTAAVAGVETPAEVATVGFDRLWAGVTADPELYSVYFALLAESATNPALKEAISYVNDRYRTLIAGLLADARKRGASPPFSPGSLAVLIVAGVQGLTLHYLELGDTPALRRALRDFKRWLAAVTKPA